MVYRIARASAHPRFFDLLRMKQEPEPVSRLYIAVSDKSTRICEEEFRCRSLVAVSFLFLGL